MSELINKHSRGPACRTFLLANVSSLALLGWASAIGGALAEDGDRPLVWVELGGQVEHMTGTSDIFSPPFFDLAAPANLATMTDAQRPPLYSIGGEGKITFTPEDTNWVLSASVRYGRSNAAKHPHYQKALAPFTFYVEGHHGTVAPPYEIFGDDQTDFRESHAILDFQAGKDVGFGLFGAHGSSVVSAGVRFAQFTTRSDATLHARPYYTLGIATVPGKYRLPHQFRKTNAASFDAKRDAQTVGPSLSWDASLPVAGNGSNMTLDFDWGANAAILFGRQRAIIHHQTTGSYYHKYGGVKHTGSYMHMPPDHNRSRTVTIPNVGGFAGVTFRYADAKISLGYRADFFFGAMDGGIDTARRENVGFYGPFATIGVGIGG